MYLFIVKNYHFNLDYFIQILINSIIDSKNYLCYLLYYINY